MDEVLQLDQMATFLETRLFRELAGPGLILCNAVGPGFLQEEALELRLMSVTKSCSRDLNLIQKQ